MGSELWTSPVTGIRRRGTKLVELRRHFESAITVEAIYEPLQSCRLDSSVSDIYSLLNQRGFDVCGVKEFHTDQIHRYIATGDVERASSLEEAVQPMLATNIISEKAALADALQILSEESWKFVIVGSTVAGILTQWDLNKPPARVYFFGILSLFEQHLNLWLRSAYTEKELRKIVEDNKFQRAKSLQGQKKSRGLPTALAENFDLADKRDLLLQSAATLERLELFVSDLEFMDNIARFRNALMHSANSVLDEMDWTDVAKLISTIEALLERSDKQIEDDALNSRELDSEHLVVSA